MMCRLDPKVILSHFSSLFILGKWSIDHGRSARPPRVQKTRAPIRLCPRIIHPCHFWKWPQCLWHPQAHVLHSVLDSAPHEFQHLPLPFYIPRTRPHRGRRPPESSTTPRHRLLDPGLAESSGPWLRRRYINTCHQPGVQTHDANLRLAPTRPRCAQDAEQPGTELASCATGSRSPAPHP